MGPGEIGGGGGDGRVGLWELRSELAFIWGVSQERKESTREKSVAGLCIGRRNGVCWLARFAVVRWGDAGIANAMGFCEAGDIDVVVWKRKEGKQLREYCEKDEAKVNEHMTRYPQPNNLVSKWWANNNWIS